MITTGAIARTTLRETGSQRPTICYTTINNRMFEKKHNVLDGSSSRRQMNDNRSEN
ncbi:hypothetical protein DPMN_037933 [Dreissena polymorpha]|uniref:Uncharacterized protein n=1 Tax=Dreissena polymorpha TaxID=45954 RepID=A0A9D4RQA2_DREPO|nr:hypothetical protein DPMN_037933 [Dreissena polymorpha]